MTKQFEPVVAAFVTSSFDNAVANFRAGPTNAAYRAELNRAILVAQAWALRNMVNVEAKYPALLDRLVLEMPVSAWGDAICAHTFGANWRREFAVEA